MTIETFIKEIQKNGTEVCSYNILIELLETEYYCAYRSRFILFDNLVRIGFNEKKHICFNDKNMYKFYTSVGVNSISYIVKKHSLFHSDECLRETSMKLQTTIRKHKIKNLNI